MRVHAINAYPLTWPVGWARTPRSDRHKSLYRMTFGKSRDEVFKIVEKLGGTGPILSTNVPLTRRGIPAATSPNVDDPGVALYWTDRNGKPCCMPCDAWATVRENIRAIAVALAALHSLERTKASQIVQRAFSGFAALPADTTTQRPTRHWREVLGLERYVGKDASKLTRDIIQSMFRSLAKERHPDNGGSLDQMSELNRAYKQAITEIEA